MAPWEKIGFFFCWNSSGKKGGGQTETHFILLLGILYFSLM
jgi:hypothetical protein